ncbi:MAG: transporter substrate-binding domain-containing protein [Spirochaetia bacterium]|nr:transporter substrate-binding domain-containing protein [Spirochaetia bacterium]
MRLKPARPHRHPHQLALAFALACLAFPSCAPKAVDAPETKLVSGSRAELTLSDLALEPRAADWLETRKAAGGALRVAMRERADSYMPQADGSVKGFDYELVAELCRVTGLELEVSVQRTIEAFFTRDGVMPPDLGRGGAHSYTPDLLETVDFYAGPFGITAWREALADWVPLWPTRNVLAGRKGEEIGGVRDLDGKRFAVIQDSIQEKSLSTLAEAEGIALSFVYGDDEESLFTLVESGGADYALDASVVMAKSGQRHPALTLSPFPEPVITIGWAVKKDDAGLASLLASFVRAAQENGLFAERWTATFLMDFGDYLDAVLATAGY